MRWWDARVGPIGDKVMGQKGGSREHRETRREEAHGEGSERAHGGTDTS